MTKHNKPAELATSLTKLALDLAFDMSIRIDDGDRRTVTGETYEMRMMRECAQLAGYLLADPFLRCDDGTCELTQSAADLTELAHDFFHAGNQHELVNAIGVVVDEITMHLDLLTEGNLRD